MPLWLFWLLLGLIAGSLAKFLMPGRDPAGCIFTVFLGIVGALLGGWLFSIFLGHSDTGRIGSTVVAFVVSLVLLIVVRTLLNRRTA